MTLTEMFDLQDRHNTSADRLELLEARIDILEEMLGLKNRAHFDRNLHFSQMQERILEMLLATEQVTQDALYSALYGNRLGERQPSYNALQVHIGKIRKILKPAGISIKVIHGVGWYLTPESRTKLWKMMT